MKKNDKPCSSRALFFVEVLTPNKVSQNTSPSFLENLNLWCASFRCFVIQKLRKIKWNRETTHTVCKHCWLTRYETEMGPKLSTAAADQNFAWICKQHQDLIGTNFQDQNYLIRTRIWSGMMWISKRSLCFPVQTWVWKENSTDCSVMKSKTFCKIKLKVIKSDQASVNHQNVSRSYMVIIQLYSPVWSPTCFGL